MPKKILTAEFRAARGGVRGDKPAWVNGTELVDVFTVGEIDERNIEIGRRLNILDENCRNLDAKIDKQISDAEERVKNDLKVSVESIPQRLLSAEVQALIKEAIVEQLRKENEQIVIDIRNLKAEFERLKQSCS